MKTERIERTEILNMLGVLLLFTYFPISFFYGILNYNSFVILVSMLSLPIILALIFR